MRSPSRSACSSRSSFVLATSVIVGSSSAGFSRLRESSRPSQASGSAARTTRSAPSTALASDVAAVSITPSARARAAPRPVGLHALIASIPARRCPTARAIDPPIRPTPTIARRNLPALVDPAGRAAGRDRGAHPVLAPRSPAAGRNPLLSGRRRARLVGRVQPAGHEAALTGPAILVEVGPAADAAALLGKERLEGRRGIDLSSTGAARKSRHALILPLVVSAVASLHSGSASATSSRGR